MIRPAMRVLQLWRHPVKSFQGERLEHALLEADGLLGDRAWGVVDDATGRVLTARREPLLLQATARLGDAGQPLLTLPDGETLEGPGRTTDAALSQWLGHPVRLVAAADHTTTDSVAESYSDPLDDTSPTFTWTLPPGRFVDAHPLLLLTTAALRAGVAAHPAGAWEVRRFRPNVLIEAEGDGWPEDAWCGREVRIGPTLVVPVKPCRRCTVVTRAQPGLDRDLDVYRTLDRAHGATLGVSTRVVRLGPVTIGDPVEVG